MRTSATGTTFIERQEWIPRSRRCGWDPVQQLYFPYKDYKGFWTFGPGILIGDGKSGPGEYANGRTEAQTEALFAAKLTKYEDAVRDVIGDDVLQNEFDAWVSFCWNLGPGWMNADKNHALQLYLANDLDGAAKALEAFDVSAGQHDPNLKKRRQAEGYIMTHPYPENHIDELASHIDRELQPHAELFGLTFARFSDDLRAADLTRRNEAEGFGVEEPDTSVEGKRPA